MVVDLLKQSQKIYFTFFLGNISMNRKVNWYTETWFIMTDE
ncbi:MAG: hypothetical protein ACJAY9_001215 [Flavobacteriales bacterium]|jgi:hypothetical protein